METAPILAQDTKGPSRNRAAVETISVVIPTLRRSVLVPRAVASVLDQTRLPEEVIVVVDGPDRATTEALSAIESDRLRIVALREHGGAARARMAGVEQATGDWIAFLDDDDSWLPDKLERQMRLAETAEAALPIVSCRCRVETALGSYVWPRRLISPGEPIADYLFIRRSLFKGETFAPTSTLLFPKRLIEQVPFAPGVHDDWDWLIRCGELSDCVMLMIEDVGCVRRAESGVKTLSDEPELAGRLDWAVEVAGQMSPKAFAGLVMHVIGGSDEARASWSGRFSLLRLGLRHGRPTPMTWFLFALHSLLPVRLRRWLRSAAHQPS